MEELFSLGQIYVSDFIKNFEPPRGEKIDLTLLLDNSTGIVRLKTIAPLDTMYGKYWYRSGVNNTMKKELKNIVETILSCVSLKENDVWIDIACNDGTLLSFVPSELIRIGIDPVDDSFKEESEKHSNLIIQDFFSAKKYKESKFGSLKAKVITSIAMFYDLENPEHFIRDIYEVLDDDGIWVLQLSYTPLMLEQVAFDNICHEHIFYYSLFNIKKMFENLNFDIVDVQLNNINGGSFRIFCMKKNADTNTFSTQTHRDVCQFRLNSLLEYEKSLHLDKKQTWENFYTKIISLKEQTLNFIISEKKKGKKIWAYGASTKGNTLLQFFGLDHTLIDGIAERSIYKFGLKTVGTEIPIYSEEEMRRVNPDYLLILPWHFINEFQERESIYLKNGGKFIVPCPEFKIIN